MKNKSYQRFRLTSLLVLGFFAVLGYALYLRLDNVIEPLITTLTAAMSMALGMWFHQAAQEKEKGKNGEA